MFGAVAQRPRWSMTGHPITSYTCWSRGIFVHAWCPMASVQRRPAQHVGTLFRCSVVRGQWRVPPLTRTVALCRGRACDGNVWAGPGHSGRTCGDAESTPEKEVGRRATGGRSMRTPAQLLLRAVGCCRTAAEDCLQGHPVQCNRCRACT